MYKVYSGTVNKLHTKGIESVLFLCTWSVIAAVEANLIAMWLCVAKFLVCLER